MKFRPSENGYYSRGHHFIFAAAWDVSTRRCAKKDLLSVVREGQKEEMSFTAQWAQLLRKIIDYPGEFVQIIPFL